MPFYHSVAIKIKKDDLFEVLALRPFIFYLLFNEHLQSKARVGGRNKN